MSRRLLLLSAILAATACTIVNGLSVPKDGGVATTDDAGVDADPCDHAYAPEKSPTAPTGGDISITVVGREYHFSPTDDAGQPIELGLDIDRTCTCPDKESCVPSKPRAQPACDDSRGRDDALRPFADLAKNPPYSFDLQGTTEDSTASGTSAVLLQVSGYNGEADDADVTLAALRSPGLREILDGGALGKKKTPNFDANDFWLTLPNEATVKSGRVLPANPVQAYVRDYQLVAQTSVSMSVTRTIIINLVEATFVAHIAKLPDGSFTIDRGTVSARLTTKDAIRAFGGLTQDKDAGTYLCTTTDLGGIAVFAAMKKQTCTNADLAADRSLDRTGAPCTALSASFEFVASPASLGPPTADPPLDVCADASLECPP